MEFRQHITERFSLNVARVRGLVRSFQQLRILGSPQRDGPDDILRAAVVLLHATLEDLLRSLEARVLQQPRKGMLLPIKFPRAHTDKRGEDKVSLADLHARYRGENVDDIVRQAVSDHLEQQSYNHLSDVKQALKRLGIEAEAITASDGRSLISMIQRRHWIAHRVDAITTHADSLVRLEGITPIDAKEVDSWICVVEHLGTQVLTHCWESVPC